MVEFSKIVSRILVVAATARELAPSEGWRTLLCGVGPVEAAIATARELAREAPLAVLHVGIAGAPRARALAPAALVIGSESCYSDLAPSNQWSPRVVAASTQLVAAAEHALPGAIVTRIGTTARVGGSGIDECDVEAMEGFAVLRSAHLASVPALEVRAIANEIEEADRARWHFEAAFDAIVRATPVLVAAICAQLAAGRPAPLTMDVDTESAHA
jgi:nucleoside phosphorylase